MRCLVRIDSHAEYNGKGIQLERGDYGNPYASALLKWAQAAKRVQYLIDNGLYLKAGDYSRMQDMSGRSWQGVS